LMLMVFTVGVYRSGDIWITMFLAFFLGVVVGPIFIEANTITHIVSDNEMRGKVFSALEIVIHFAFIVSMFGSAWLSDRIGPYWILIGVGAVFLCLGVIGLLRLKAMKNFVQGNVA